LPARARSPPRRPARGAQAGPAWCACTNERGAQHLRHLRAPAHLPATSEVARCAVVPACFPAFAASVRLHAPPCAQPRSSPRTGGACVAAPRGPRGWKECPAASAPAAPRRPLSPPAHAPVWAGSGMLGPARDFQCYSLLLLSTAEPPQKLTCNATVAEAQSRGRQAGLGAGARRGWGLAPGGAGGWPQGAGSPPRVCRAGGALGSRAGRGWQRCAAPYRRARGAPRGQARGPMGPRQPRKGA
jgi:hypothetical protein